MDIQNMPLIDEDLREEPFDYKPESASEVIVTAQDNANDDCLSQHSQKVLHLTHEAEVYDANSEKTRIFVLSQKIKPMSTFVQQQSSEFDKIENYIDPVPVRIQNHSTATAILPKPCHLTPINLTDVLVLPKSPQRKGVRNIKRAPFVLTSDQWRSVESEKLRVKQEKEEKKKEKKRN